MGDIADFYDYLCWPEDDEPHWATCKHCGKEGLEWIQLDGRWWLYDQDRRHKCDLRRLNARVRLLFDDLTRGD